MYTLKRDGDTYSVYSTFQDAVEVLAALVTFEIVKDFQFGDGTLSLTSTYNGRSVHYKIFEVKEVYKSNIYLYTDDVKGELILTNTFDSYDKAMEHLRKLVDTDETQIRTLDSGFITAYVENLDEGEWGFYKYVVEGGK